MSVDDGYEKVLKNYLTGYLDKDEENIFGATFNIVEDIIDSFNPIKHFSGMKGKSNFYNITERKRNKKEQLAG